MTLTWGILGASKFALERMGPAIHAAKGARLAAVASRDLGKVKPFQDYAPDAKGFDSYDALLADPDIDVVYIPLPHTLHVEWTLKAIAAGKHVLAEKPFAMAVPDFDPVIAARDASGLHVTEAYMISHHPQWHRIKHLLADGAIGDLMHVSAAFSYDNSGDPGNIRNSAATGGGALRDIGVYILGSAQMATGHPLTDIAAQIRYQDGFDTTTCVQARLGQATYHGYVSMRMHLYQAMEFHGTQGVIRVTAPTNAGSYGEARLEIYQPDHGMRVERFPEVNHYVTQVEAFGNKVAYGTDYPWTLEDARDVQHIIDQVLDVATPL